MRLEAVVAVEEEALAIEVVAAVEEAVSVIEAAVAVAEVLVTVVVVAVVEVQLSREPQDQHLRRVFLIITSRLTIVFSLGFGDRGGRGGGRGFGGGRGAPRGGAGGGRGGKPGMRGGAKVIIVSLCSLSAREISELGSRPNQTDPALAQLRSPTDMEVSLSLAAARKISWSPRT